MKKAYKWAALLLAATMLTGCAQKTQKEVPELLEPSGIQFDTTVAYVKDLYKTSFYGASVKPYVESLAFPVSGEVKTLNAHLGMTVEEGDVLIELNQESMQTRKDRLQQDIGYAKQDGAYTDEIYELEIDILEAELGQLQNSATELRAQETELKETETTLQAKDTALQAEEAELTQKLTALKESLLTPEVSTPAPEESAPAAEESTSTPEESAPTSEESASAPEESTADTQENVSAPTQNTAALTEKEIELTETEIKLIQNERTIVATDLTKNAEMLALLTEELALLDKEIALKGNEIEQKKTLLRQEGELRDLEISGKQKELSELNVSLEDNILRAPFSGRIIYGDQIVPGSWVTAEDPVVFLADDNRLTIECEFIPNTTIHEADRIYAHIGSKEYELEWIPVNSEEQIRKRLSGETLMTSFKLVDEDAVAEIEAGQYAAVFIWSRYTEDALVVPSNALMKDNSGDYVYVEENGSRVKRAVVTGTETNSLVQIVEGLEEGDVVYVKD